MPKSWNLSTVADRGLSRMRVLQNKLTSATTYFMCLWERLAKHGQRCIVVHITFILSKKIRESMSFDHIVPRGKLYIKKKNYISTIFRWTCLNLYLNKERWKFSFLSSGKCHDFSRCISFSHQAVTIYVISLKINLNTYK